MPKRTYEVKRKDGPWQRAIRTFWGAVGGYALSWSAILLAPGKEKAGVTIVVLNLVASALAGASAYFLARSKWRAKTVWQKVVAQFCQVAGTGLSTVALNELTEAAAMDFARALYAVILGAFFAAVATYSVNQSGA